MRIYLNEFVVSTGQSSIGMSLSDRSIFRGKANNAVADLRVRGRGSSGKGWLMGCLGAGAGAQAKVTKIAQKWRKMGKNSAKLPQNWVKILIFSFCLSLPVSDIRLAVVLVLLRPLKTIQPAVLSAQQAAWALNCNGKEWRERVA